MAHTRSRQHAPHSLQSTHHLHRRHKTRRDRQHAALHTIISTSQSAPIGTRTPRPSTRPYSITLTVTLDLTVDIPTKSNSEPRPDPKLPATHPSAQLSAKPTAALQSSQNQILPSSILHSNPGPLQLPLPVALPTFESSKTDWIRSGFLPRPRPGPCSRVAQSRLRRGTEDEQGDGDGKATEAQLGKESVNMQLTELMEALCDIAVGDCVRVVFDDGLEGEDGDFGGRGQWGGRRVDGVGRDRLRGMAMEWDAGESEGDDQVEDEEAMEVDGERNVSAGVGLREVWFAWR